MKKKLIHRGIIVQALLFFTAFAGTAVASADRSTLPPQTPNGSYLVQTKYTANKTLNDDLFDPGFSKNMRTEYENRVEADEARDNAGLSWYFEAKARFDGMRDMARRAMGEVYKYRLRMETAHVRETAEGIREIREPVAAAVLAASLYTGHSMKFKMAGAPVTTTVAVKDKSGSVTVPLPSSGLSSTVAYNQEDKMNAQLAQQLSDNVSAVVGSSSKQGSAQIVYSVSF